MAATALTVRTLGDTPLTDPSDTAPDTVNGNSFPNSGQTILRINNTAGSSGTITFHPADPTFGPENLAVSGEVITVQGGGTRTAEAPIEPGATRIESR